jgi:hypothetical protein
MKFLDDREKIMSVTVTRMDDEPILIADFAGKVTAEDIVTMFELSTALIEDGEAVFRISDFTDVTSEIAEVFKAVDTLRQRPEGSSGDLRITPVLVGRNQWSVNAHNIVKDIEAMSIPIFFTRDDALAYIRKKLG